MKKTIEEIAEERQRQIDVEGWTTEHDDGHDDGSLAMAATCYAAPERIYRRERVDGVIQHRDPWPWEQEADKRPVAEDGGPLDPSSYEHYEIDRIRFLVKAGALIVAEIDRLKRRLE